MSRKARETNKKRGIIAGIAVILIILLIVIVFGFFTRKFGKSTFYCQYKEELIIGEKEKIFPREAVRLDVRYLLFFSESDAEYTVKITPNAEKDFSFHAGDSTYRYSETEDLTAWFALDMQDGYFTLDLSAQPNVEELLSDIYDLPVSLEGETEANAEEAYYLLTVTSGKGDTVKIKFGVESKKDGSVIDRIELDTEEITF